MKEAVWARREKLGLFQNALLEICTKFNQRVQVVSQKVSEDAREMQKNIITSSALGMLGIRENNHLQLHF